MTNDQFTSLNKTLNQNVEKRIREKGFEFEVTNDFNRILITVIIIKLNEMDDQFIIKTQLCYARNLLDRKSQKEIDAIISQTNSYDYINDKESIRINSLLTTARSLSGFFDQMCLDETRMNVYYKLLSEGLITKDITQ